MFGEDIDDHTFFDFELVVIGEELLDVFVEDVEVDGDGVVEHGGHENFHEEFVVVIGCGVDAVDGDFGEAD